MKHEIEIAACDLKPALAGLAKVAPRKPEQPALGCVKIVADCAGGTTTLTATDGDTHIRMEVPAINYGQAGAFLVPLAYLRDAAKACGRTDLLILKSDGDITATIVGESGGTRIPRTVSTPPVTDFPETPRVKGKPAALDAHAREAIGHALACASKDPTRQVLNGARIEEGNTVVGTDGRHLYRCNGMDMPGSPSLVIPNLPAFGWKGLHGVGDWELTADGDRFRLTGGTWAITGKAVDGTYPNWRQVVPDGNDFKSSATFDATALNALASTVMGLPGAKSPNSPVGLRLGNGKVALMARDGEGGKFAEVPLCQASSSGEAIVFLNRDYVAKALRFGLDRADVKDALSPVRFGRGGDTGRDMIVMPVRVADAPEAGERQTKPQTPKHEPMKQTNNNINGSRTKQHDAADTSPVDAASGHIGAVKDLLRQAAGGLNELAASLRQLKAEQKSTEKEIRQVRSTIRTLQKVEL